MIPMKYSVILSNVCLLGQAHLSILFNCNKYNKENLKMRNWKKQANKNSHRQGRPSSTWQKHICITADLTANITISLEPRILSSAKQRIFLSQRQQSTRII